MKFVSFKVHLAVTFSIQSLAFGAMLALEELGFAYVLLVMFVSIALHVWFFVLQKHHDTINALLMYGRWEYGYNWDAHCQPPVQLRRHRLTGRIEAYKDLYWNAVLPNPVRFVARRLPSQIAKEETDRVFDGRFKQFCGRGKRIVGPEGSHPDGGRMDSFEEEGR